MNRTHFVIFCTILIISGWLEVKSAVDPTDVENHYALSIIGMVPLLKLEMELTVNMENYVNQLEQKRDLIRLILYNLQKENAKSKNNPEEYLSNPLNSFALVRRMHGDWIKWQKFMQKQVGKSQINFIEQMHAMLPTTKDLDEATAAMMRLQETYLLSVDNMVAGILNGKQTDAKLSLYDCYTFGVYLRKQSQCQLSKSWLEAALQLYTPNMKKSNEILGIGLADIWDLIANNLIELNNFEEAQSAIRLAVKHKPNDIKFALHNESLSQFIAHEKLCREEVAISNSKRLYCCYNSTTHPFLKLAPLKMEIIAEDPYLVLYHDVIYDHEMQELIRISIPKIVRGMVGPGIVVSDRTVQKTEFYAHENRVVARMEQLAADISGFEINAELRMQIVNYGLGGQFFNHIDYINLTKMPDIEHFGERIAIVLFYLNDVELGGDTVFAEIGKIVKPKKGSAIFWHHLDNAGNGNSKSLHAGCPVAIGSKWVAARLIPEVGQMFRKPCPKDYKLIS